MERQPTSRASVQIAVAALLFGLVPIIVKSSALPPVELTVGRLMFAAATLAIWRSIQSLIRAPMPRQEGRLLHIFRAHSIRYVFFGFLHALTILTSFAAIKMINTAVAAILLYAGAIYLAGLTLVFLREKAQPVTLLLLALAVLGVGIVCWTPPGASSGGAIGYALGALSGVLMALVYFVGKVLAKSEDRLDMALVQQVIALPLVAPLLAYSDLTAFDLGAIGIVALLGVGCTAVPFALLYAGMQNASGQVVGLLLMLELATPVLLSPLLLGEVPAMREAIGGGLIVVACLLAAIWQVRTKDNCNCSRGDVPSPRPGPPSLGFGK